MTMFARMSFPADQKLLPFGSEQNHVQVTAASVWGCCISMERSYRRHTKPAGTTSWGREVSLSKPSPLNGSSTPTLQ
jgi:hypothetical protein